MPTLITHHPAAPSGIVQKLTLYDASLFTPGSAVLCRNTAPCVAFAYALLKRDVSCRILGRDIGATLVALVRKLRAVGLEDLRSKLNAWSEREVTRAIGEGRSPEGVQDKTDCLAMFISALDEDSRTIPDLIAKIELMFTDDAENAASRVTLSTVHKSKGLEYPTVFILDADRLMPSRFAKQHWQKEQERNIQYVAITRAQNALYYITSDRWKTER